MTYAPVNGLQLYYEVHGSGRPLVLLHGGLLTIDLSFGQLLEPLAAARQVIAVELQGHGHTALTDRPMTIDALAGDVVGLLDHLGIEQADVFGFSLGGLVAYAMAIEAPARVGRLIVASADALRPPGRESVPLTEDRMPTAADFEQVDECRLRPADHEQYYRIFIRRDGLVQHFVVAGGAGGGGRVPWSRSRSSGLSQCCPSVERNHDEPQHHGGGS